MEALSQVRCVASSLRMLRVSAGAVVLRRYRQTTLVLWLWTDFSITWGCVCVELSLPLLTTSQEQRAHMNYSGTETVGGLSWFNERDGFVEAVVRGFRKVGCGARHTRIRRED